MITIPNFPFRIMKIRHTTLIHVYNYSAILTSGFHLQHDMILYQEWKDADDQTMYEYGMLWFIIFA